MTARHPAGTPIGGRFASTSRPETTQLDSTPCWTLAGVLAGLEELADGDRTYDWSAQQAEAAAIAYLDRTGHDLSIAPLALDPAYRIDRIDRAYNWTPDTSVAQYKARWAATGRLHGEDLDCQVAWYAHLVDAAAAGRTPPVLLHELDGVTVLVDGGHRVSAHRAAGLDIVTAYVARGPHTHKE